jgi:hypothetical protein
MTGLVLFEPIGVAPAWRRRESQFGGEGSLFDLLVRVVGIIVLG